jgi:hypothetical protein
MKFWETTNEVTIKNGVKTLSSCTPEERPPYQKWMRMMKISHAAWYHDPDGRERAENIMKNVGVEIKSEFEKLKDVFGKK